MRRFVGQVAIITGGTGGLGQVLCARLAEEGAKVYACGMEKSVEELKLQPGFASDNICLEPVDVRNIPRLKAWIAGIVKREGRLDLLVNAAGICPLADWREVTEELWDEVAVVNLKSVFFACQAVLETMLEQGGGAIVNIGSTASYNGGVVTMPGYGASKAGVHTLTKWLAVKTAAAGIRVNTVVPGPFRSAMTDAFTPEMRQRLINSTPNGKLGSPEEVAQGILFMADGDASGHITGAALDICGGAYLR